MTWWKTILWAIAVVLAFHLIAGDMGCFRLSDSVEFPPESPESDTKRQRDTLVVRDSLTVSRVDTVRIIESGQTVRCQHFSINRASYSCRD
jgi:hypothetical protein